MIHQGSPISPVLQQLQTFLPKFTIVPEVTWNVSIKEYIENMFWVSFETIALKVLEHILNIAAKNELYLVHVTPLVNSLTLRNIDYPRMIVPP